MQRPEYLDEFYGDLPVGVIVYDSKYIAQYYNPMLQKILQQAANEYGGVNNALKEFTKGCKKHQHLYAWIMRVDPKNTADALVLRVLRSTAPKFLGQDGAMITVVPLREMGVHSVAGRSIYVYGALRLDVENQLIYFNRERLRLPTTEYALLHYACEHPDTVMSKADLLRKVWGKRATNTRTLDVYVSRVNQRFKAFGVERLIQTIHGRGYLFEPQILL